MFDKYGKIDDAMIIHDRKTGMSRGFGFVYFASSDDAHNAKEDTNGLEIDGWIFLLKFLLIFSIIILRSNDITCKQMRPLN